MKDDRCFWIGSCSLCPYLEECPCKEKEYKYYLYFTHYKKSELHCKYKSDNYNEIFVKLGKLLKNKIAKSYIDENNIVEITITLDGNCSWNNSIKLQYEIY